MLSEAFTYHQRLLRSQLEEFGDMVRARFRIGGLLSLADYVQAQRVRNVQARICHSAPEGGCDCLADHVQYGSDLCHCGWYDDGPETDFTGPYNLTGMPAISVPCGFTSAGLPVGLPNRR